MDTNEAINYARQMRRIVKDQGPHGFLKADHALISLLDEIEWRDERCSLEDFERLRAEVERLNRILGRIVEWRGESTTRIRTDTDAFAAAAEYLRPNAVLTGLRPTVIGSFELPPRRSG